MGAKRAAKASGQSERPNGPSQLGLLRDANSGSSRDWARLLGIPFSYTFELRDKGEFGHLLPEDQIKPACEEAYVGVTSILSYVYDKNFPNDKLPTAAATACVHATGLIVMTTLATLLVTLGSV
ncbi:unnamed protein product [Arctogadus glacialis]